MLYKAVCETLFQNAVAHTALLQLAEVFLSMEERHPQELPKIRPGPTDQFMGHRIRPVRYRPGV
jgi:hypothetical protein